jgi:hypothetical protein
MDAGLKRKAPNKAKRSEGLQRKAGTKANVNSTADSPKIKKILGLKTNQKNNHECTTIYKRRVAASH